MTEIEEYKAQAAATMKELVQAARLAPGQIVVVGCSTSEVTGHRIGSFSAPEIGQALFEGIQSVLNPLGLLLAAQCCEHLNRAIVIDRPTAGLRHLPAVNVVPQPKAGGSFATAAYHGFESPVVLEHIHADAGLDIGGTLIGMHLREVAVPVRLEQNHIGQASVLAARVRPKFIGGERAIYDERMK
ncbi:MAG: TIGR01440 family protein [Oscillospiraceae bacterium]|nr:TIGR01440 family protein [Oscillospiraceae bacterium]